MFHGCRRRAARLALALILLSGMGSAGHAQIVVTPPTQPKEATPPAKAAAKPARIVFDRPEHILRWIDGYRQKPDPQRVPEAVKAMSALGLFKDTETAAVYVGFVAGILGDNGAQADKLVSRMFPMPPEDQVAVIRAIAYSGLPDWKALLGRFAERMPARAVLIDRFLAGKLPTLETLSLEDSPAGLDTLWGYYFGTAKREPVLRIVATLAWSTDKEKVERLTIGNMAKWTLANNATRDMDLLRLLKSEVARQPKPVKAPLEEVIEAAETFETGKIRKQAMASIEELKAKGPQSSRTAQWWAQAGTTAFALGCVAASALGQIQFGIPCVVGGPLGTVAAKYVLPN